MPRNWQWGKKRKSGFRSGLEETVAKALDDKGIKWTYESGPLDYERPVRKGKCLKCGNNKIVSVKRYTADFFLENGIIIEVKGRLTSVDRTKLLAVKKTHPSLKLVIYLGADNRLTKNNEQRYSTWCEKNNFDYSINSIPKRWINYRKEMQ